MGMVQTSLSTGSRSHLLLPFRDVHRRAEGGAPTGLYTISPAVNSGSNTPGCISLCKLPVESGIQAEINANDGLS